jgi:dTDP-glucose 4,6-dehydratase
VVCFDNLLTGDRDRNIAHLFVRRPTGSASSSTTTTSPPSTSTSTGEVDAVLHFASPASPIDYLQLPIQTLKVGSLGTHNALGLAKAKDARFMLASTSEVYGDPQVHPQPESYWGQRQPDRPAWGLRRGQALRRGAGVRLPPHPRRRDPRPRIFNTYGPRMRMDDGRAVPTFITQALAGEPLTVHGDGSQTRSLCYVDDLIDGFLALLTSDTSGRSTSAAPSR